MSYDAEYVLFNDGDNEDLYALVIGGDDGGKLDLFVPEIPKVVRGVPQREKKDYGPEGGGLTWHS